MKAIQLMVAWLKKKEKSFDYDMENGIITMCLKEARRLAAEEHRKIKNNTANTPEEQRQADKWCRKMAQKLAAKRECKQYGHKN